MWLLRAANRRGPEANLWLGASTALVAGLVNVCSVMIFFAFSANVTGHMATLAEEVVKGHWHQVSVVLGWMFMFVLGAFVAGLSVTALGRRNPRLGHAAPLLLQTLLLGAVAYYGHRHYLETLRETEVLVGALLFSMGVQNGTVTAVSNAAVRTTHLTGLFTDIACGLALILQPRHRHDTKLGLRLRLHGGILAGYTLGGLVGGLACNLYGFRALYLGVALLAGILARDVMALRRAGLLLIPSARPPASKAARSAPQATAIHRSARPRPG